MDPGAPPTPSQQAAAPPAASPTTLLGRYQLGRVLGRGSFAKVYQACSVADSSPVAIKIIDKKSKSLNAVTEAQVLREVSAMRLLQSHPNILKIHEVMATRSKIYLVMELAPGGELFSKLTRRGRFTEPATRRLFRQLISALIFCHENGVAHRDIKPQNLLLDGEGNLKVSDFGLSALPEQVRGDGLLHTACGTPAFTAPEVVARRGYSGPKADAWSCGVILYMLLCGSLPFDDNNLVSMYKKIARRDYQFPNWVSKPARYVINQLLHPNPTSRMSLEALLETAWFKKSSVLSKSQSDGSLYEMAALSKDYDFGSVSSVNAFDIISLSAGLNLSGLFETSNKQSKRFTSTAPFEDIRDTVREVGGRLGYAVEKMKGGSLVLRKGGSVLIVEVWEIAQSLMLVEVKVGDGGADFGEHHWGEWRAGLEELVLSWQTDDV
ncbi:CBL-interacting serine/threonine-protein kinase 4-like [Punica granatum]|uniref:non-specific serine/threonine protein kinase n=2 Tax=Punica granatum TaxID=22663 RepID=A0A218XSP5_PUNGR|nr:CBL-interacting serine/threonine-protein kinase 4-like [Punica granatum]OWM87838.1 hypothetical protein CDL15_Pgr019422 [Punica granatum]PKI51107.1 hypothetical protein CRG98_028487 [Punica granatum]